VEAQQRFGRNEDPKKQGLNIHESKVPQHFRRSKYPEKNRGSSFVEAKLKVISKEMKTPTRPGA
jgi:hypothetical protein